MNFFPRPKHPRPAPGYAHPAAMKAAPTEPDSGSARASTQGTWIALAGIAITAVALHGTRASDVARLAAIGTGISIAISVAFDARRGLRNLIRADLLALLSYYFLTFFEFLFPQENFDILVTQPSAKSGSLIVLIGFAGLLIGRHLLRPKRQPFAQLLTQAIPPGWFLAILWCSAAIGYAHMLLAVNFNFFEFVEALIAPRFSQPWGRGRFGDWKALFNELGMLIQLIPPIAGIVFARRQRYALIHLVLVGAIFLFTLFYGFSTGTRNVFISYLVTFFIGYSFSLAQNRQRELAVISAVCLFLTLFATTFMLQFRTVGLKSYLSGEYVPPLTRERTLYVDYNLYAVCRLTEVFPARQDYLGFEIPYNALIRPIPRAMWPGKPVGLSTSIEQAMGQEGLTISASFAGEAYMSGGRWAVLAIGLFFGALTGWWGYLASTKNSELGILIYASGFFAAVISMRSLFVFTTALLPTVAAIVLGTFLVRTLVAQARRWIMRPAAQRPPPPRFPGPRQQQP